MFHGCSHPIVRPFDYHCHFIAKWHLLLQNIIANIIANYLKVLAAVETTEKNCRSEHESDFCHDTKSALRNGSMFEGFLLPWQHINHLAF